MCSMVCFALEQVWEGVVACNIFSLLQKDNLFVAHKKARVNIENKSSLNMWPSVAEWIENKGRNSKTWVQTLMAAVKLGFF